jgi:hypothetical protein
LEIRLVVQQLTTRRTPHILLPIVDINLTSMNQRYTRRLQKELSELQKTPPVGIEMDDVKDLQRFNLLLLISVCSSHILHSRSHSPPPLLLDG